MEIEIGSGEVVFDRLHMTKHSEYITDKAEIESYSSALSLYVSVVRETQNHSFSISILEVRQILHYLMRKRKQAGTCIRCEDLSVCTEINLTKIMRWDLYKIYMIWDEPNMKLRTAWYTRYWKDMAEIPDSCLINDKCIPEIHIWDKH